MHPAFHRGVAGGRWRRAPQGESWLSTSRRPDHRDPERCRAGPQQNFVTSFHELPYIPDASPNGNRPADQEHCHAMNPTLASSPAQQPAGWRSLSDLTDDGLVALAREQQSAGVRGAHAPAQPPAVPRHAQRAARQRCRAGCGPGNLPARVHQARQLSTQRQVRRLALAGGVQRGADDAPTYSRRHGLARRCRRGRHGGRKRPRSATRPRPINSWKPRTRARCSSTPSTRCRKTSARSSCCARCKAWMCARPRSASA